VIEQAIITKTIKYWFMCYPCKQISHGLCQISLSVTYKITLEKFSGVEF